MKLLEIAERTLSAFATELAAQGVDVPEVQYVTAGSAIAWDGEQLVVTNQSIGQGRPGAPQAQAYRSGSELLTTTFAVLLLRKVAALTNEAILESMLPDVGELNASGATAMADGEALARAAIKIHAANTITEPGVDFVVGECSSVGPDGALAGYRQLIEVSL